jgi:hypothetical protein
MGKGKQTILIKTLGWERGFYWATSSMGRTGFWHLFLYLPIVEKMCYQHGSINASWWGFGHAWKLRGLTASVWENLRRKIRKGDYSILLAEGSRRCQSRTAPRSKSVKAIVYTRKCTLAALLSMFAPLL